MVASLPEELLKFYNNQWHTRKSCGSFSKLSTYVQATALINSKKGRAFKSKYTFTL